MDIVLATNTENPSLALRSVQVFTDGGVCFVIDVRSGWVSASYLFFVETTPFFKFVAALHELKQSLRGEAVLKPEWEEQYVRFTGDGLGRITVMGVLMEHGAHFQRLRFEFMTDQTCLSSLINGCEALARSANPNLPRP